MRLPPLNACRAFEAAARLGSFARAATELNVSPTAISRHVKTLEAWTGRRLFIRSNNAIITTDDARQLAPAITEAVEFHQELTRLSEMPIPWTMPMGKNEAAW